MRLGVLAIFRGDQQQALRFGPGAKGLAGGRGLLQRGGTLDLMQDVLCLAVELIAGMAANDLGRGFQRPNRFVRMRELELLRRGTVGRPWRSTRFILQFTSSWGT